MPIQNTDILLEHPLFSSPPRNCTFGYMHIVYLFCSFPSSPYLLQTLGGAIKLSPQISEIKQEQKRL